MFKIKVLKAEIKTLKADNKELTKSRDSARKMVAQFNETLHLRDVALSKVKEGNAALKKENKKLGKLVREQSEADLLINALKAVGIIPDKEAKTLADYNDRANLLDRQRQQVALSDYQGALQAGPFGGAGQGLQRFFN